MSQRGFLLCVFPALSTVLLASDAKGPTVAGTSVTDPAHEPGVPALFYWGDVNGDGRLDLAAVSSDGTLQLLANIGEGRFEDVTERVGLSEVGNAALALWADYDGDGRLDLFVGAREGASRLFRNQDSVFVDLSAGSGLASEGAVQSAQWLDHDGDGRLDLFVVTAEKSQLFRGLEGGFFERAELPLTGLSAPAMDGSLLRVAGGDTNGDEAGGLGQPSAPWSPSKKSGTRADGSVDASDIDDPSGPGGRFTVGPSPSIGGVTPITLGCLNVIRDQGNPGSCLQASSTPTLGRLYPISANLFVAVGGNVGIGTTSPGAKLDVAGTTRMTDTLTLAPSIDQALDVSTGSIYKSGALFIHTKGGTNNTALGLEALVNATTGYSNTASGYRALFSNTIGNHNTASGHDALANSASGNDNVAIGFDALRDNTFGSNNTASGSRALSSNTSGNDNTASGFAALHDNMIGSNNTATGYRALYSTTGSNNTANGFEALFNNTTGVHNIASGVGALYFNTSGARNIALGRYAGVNLTTGNDNITIGNYGVAAEGATIRIGTSGIHTRAFISGIRGVTTGTANAIPVVIDSAGQLGTVSSSRRFKKDIADMGDRTERLLELRPVVFRYKQEQRLANGGEVPLEYGLIAEEVAEIFPDLVVYDEEGQPFTVKYHLLSSMLLNELMRTHERFEAQREKLQGLEAQTGDHAREIEELRTSLAALTSRTPSAPVAISIGSR